MERFEHKLIPYEVVYICDDCKIGVMKYIKLGNSGFRHKCNNCDIEQDLNYKYPTVRYKIEEVM